MRIAKCRKGHLSLHTNSRVVKGDRLKFCCIRFVGSNPTSCIYGNGMSPLKRPPPSNWGEKITRTDAVRHDYIT